jgi:3-methyladenine DNA glycosylase AlkD
MAEVSWDMVERWSTAIDNWEHVDQLAAAVTSSLLVRAPELLGRLEAMAAGDSPWRRRLALVSLIGAFRKDPRWQPALEAMSERCRSDIHPTNRRAAAWARRELAAGSKAGGPR